MKFAVVSCPSCIVETPNRLQHAGGGRRGSTTRMIFLRKGDFIATSGKRWNKNLSGLQKYLNFYIITLLFPRNVLIINWDLNVYLYWKWEFCMFWCPRPSYSVAGTSRQQPSQLHFSLLSHSMTPDSRDLEPGWKLFREFNEKDRR